MNRLIAAIRNKPKTAAGVAAALVLLIGGGILYANSWHHAISSTAVVPEASPDASPQATDTPTPSSTATPSPTPDISTPTPAPTPTPVVNDPNFSLLSPADGVTMAQGVISFSFTPRINATHYVLELKQAGGSGDYADQNDEADYPTSQTQPSTITLTDNLAPGLPTVSSNYLWRISARAFVNGQLVTLENSPARQITITPPGSN